MGNLLLPLRIHDLIVNIAVPCKDLSSIAITVLFASPVLNILIAFCIRFAVLDPHQNYTIHVQLEYILCIRFKFCVLNGLLIVISGLVVGREFIPRKLF